MTHSFPVHQKLTHDHLYPNAAQKIRNHLAEDVLNKDMLHLKKLYRSSLKSSGKELDAAIKLLAWTSQFVDIFRVIRPIRDMSDPRIKIIKDAGQWLQNWESDVLTNGEAVKDQKKKLMCWETRDDTRY